MNETNETPETLAAVLAKMRADVADGENAFFIRADWLALCDRIEAAAKRECEEAKDYFAKLHDGPSMICTAKNCAVRNIGLSLAAAPRKFDEPAPGNASAMREALEAIANEIRTWRASIVGITNDERRLLNVACAALSAPARNCDRFADCNSAWKAYNAISNRERLPGFDFWLFAPEGGAE